jgi:hypothetical protein
MNIGPDISRIFAMILSKMMELPLSANISPSGRAFVPKAYGGPQGRGTRPGAARPSRSLGGRATVRSYPKIIEAHFRLGAIFPGLAGSASSIGGAPFNAEFRRSSQALKYFFVFRFRKNIRLHRFFTREALIGEPEGVRSRGFGV